MPLFDFVPDGVRRLLGYAPAPATASEQEAAANSAQQQQLPLLHPPVGAAAAGPDLAFDVVREQVLREFLASQPEEGKPMTSGGRSTVPENGLYQLPNYQAPIMTDYPFDALVVLENMAIFNRHISYAVENVVTLAATDLKIEFSDTVTDKEARKMRAHLIRAQSRWYEFTDGQASLTNDLFAQLATFGVLCAEMVPNKKLTGVDYVAKVSPHKIRFIYDTASQSHKPFQQVPYGLQTLAGTALGYKELNQETFKYITLRKYKATPYPVPPFIAALEDIRIENRMLANFGSMMDRLGMLGFLSVLVKTPQQFDGESPTAYRARLLTHLERDIRPQVEHGYRTGVTIGFEGAHKFELQGTDMNVQGAEGLLKMIKGLVYAGMHQDPNMHGDNQATTETFGRVILTKMMAQIEGYQRVVASFFEHLYLMELYLAGFRPGYVLCTFSKALIGDQKREEETEGLRIANVIRKRDEGIISQEVAATELGYDRPDQKVVPPLRQVAGHAPSLADNKDGTESKGSGNPVAEKQANEATARLRPRLAALYGSLGSSLPTFDYSTPVGCGQDLSFDEEAGTDFHDDELQARAARYVADVTRRFRKAVNRTRAPLRKALYKLPKNASQADLADTVLYHLVKNWKRNFTEPVQLLATTAQASAYITFRNDKRVFTSARGFSAASSFAFKVPKATFGVLDYRAMEYLAQHDTFYLGKFIVDPDTRTRLLNFIGQSYLGENSPIGAGQAGITKFLDLYAQQVQLEEYKIRRVLETTLNKCRNYANLNYIAQAELEQFEVVEVQDKKTCDYCAHMHGQVFTVAGAVEQMTTVISASPEDAPALSPFATTVPIEEFKKLDAGQLQARGISTPSYHCHCRGRVVAVI